MNSIKKLISSIIFVVMVGAGIFFFLSSDVEHIEDTNGADNYELTTITDQNIIKMDIGALGSSRSKSILSGDLVKFSSKKFTGVEEIMYNNYIGKSDVYFQLLNYEITGGNFKLVVVLNDEIIDEIEPGMIVDYRLDDIKGTFSLRIVGESASYKFGISGSDIANFEHTW